MTNVRNLRATWHLTADLISRATDIALSFYQHPYDCMFIALAEHLEEPLITADLALVRGLSGTPMEKLVKPLR